MENYYKVLGVSRFASKEEIRRAYIEILKKYHPDVFFGDKEYAEKVTSDANIAFEFLSDPAKKSQLDQYLKSKDIEEQKLRQAQHVKSNQQTNQNLYKKNQNKKTTNQQITSFFKNLASKFGQKKQAGDACDIAVKKSVKNKLSNKKNAFSETKLNILIGLVAIAILILIIILIVVL